MVCFPSFLNVPIPSGLEECRRDVRENFPPWKRSAYTRSHRDTGHPSRDLWNNLPFLRFPWSERKTVASFSYVLPADATPGRGPKGLWRSCTSGGGVVGAPHHMPLSKLYQRNLRSATIFFFSAFAISSYSVFSSIAYSGFSPTFCW